MHSAAHALLLLPLQPPTESSRQATAEPVAGSPRARISKTTQAHRNRGRVLLACAVVLAHLTGLATLAYLSNPRIQPAEVAPIQVSMIAAAPSAAPATTPEPAPEPAVEPVTRAEPPTETLTRPPPPAPAAKPKPAPVKKTPPKPIEKPQPLTESPSALSPAEAASPPEPTAAESTPASPPARTESAPSRATTSAPSAGPAVSAARFDAAYLNNPPPTYPMVSRRMREEGQVTLRVLVSSEGRPSQIELRTSSGSERLDRAAREAVSRWRFVPARRGDEAIDAWVLVPIVFKLQGN